MTTDYIECPECGFKHEDDLYDGFDANNSTTWECSECEAQFFVERDFSVHYYVGKVSKPGNNAALTSFTAAEHGEPLAANE